jgi:hypothetical protein
MFSEMYFILNLLKWRAILWGSALICERRGKSARDLLEERQIPWKIRACDLVQELGVADEGDEE